MNENCESNRTGLKWFMFMLCGMAMALALLAAPTMKVSAASHSEGEKVKSGGTVVATYDNKDRMVFKKQSSASKNTSALNSLLGNDKKKTLIIKDDISVNGLVRIGSNTTIIATGATITQKTDGKGIISHVVDGSKYNAIKNVKIKGGTWQNEKNKASSTTMMRFCHGSNITIKNAKVITNYQGHALELIACKDVTVSKCTLKAKNSSTKSSTSVEEPLQIDIATKTTAPGVYSETNGKAKYVKGQTCKNITVKNCTISGSRGVCCNYSPKQSEYLNKYHKNIKIVNNTITGTSAEAVALFNTVGFTVKNNTIKTKSTRSGTAYADGITIVMEKKDSNTTKYKNVISGNKIYGKYRGIMSVSHGSGKYGPTTIKNNKIYVPNTSNGLSLNGITKLTKSNNKISKWK